MRQQQDLNLRGQSPVDFKSTSLTTRTCCHPIYNNYYYLSILTKIEINTVYNNIVMSINNDKNVDMNVNNYTASELFQILNIQDPTKENIQKATDKMVEQFIQQGNTDMVKFFRDAETRMLNALPEPNDKNLVNFDNKFNSQNTDDNQMGQWWSEQQLIQSDSIQADKTTERKQTIGLFDNSHNIMKRERLGVNNSFSVPVAQGQMNPNLKNTCTRLVNIDSQFRQNSFPAKNGLPYDQIVNPHTSTYSSTDFTVDLTDTLHNVISLKLYSVNIPYSWYTIDLFYGTNCFLIEINDIWYNVNITSGNYSVNSENDNYVYKAINDALNQAIYERQIADNPSSSSTISVPTDIYFTYNSINGTTKFTPKAGTTGKILWYLPKGEVNNTDIFNGDPPVMCDTNCGIGTKSNSNIGYLLGYRNTNYSWTSNSPIVSEAVVNLYGPRYLMLILDDYNQNHLNKGLVSIQDVPKTADLPSYYDPNLPCVKTQTDPTQGVIQPYPFTLQDAPRKLTKAKQDTINSIMKDRSQTTSNKLKSVTDSDMFALIPIKKSINTQVGEGLTEFSGPIQVNERIYFGPVDIDRMRIRLVTDKGDTLNLNGNDWSFCMIAEVLYQY